MGSLERVWVAKLCVRDVKLLKIAILSQ